MAGKIQKAVVKAAKAVKNKISRPKRSKLKTAAAVAAVTAAVVGAGLAGRAMMKKSGTTAKKSARKRK